MIEQISYAKNYGVAIDNLLQVGFRDDICEQQSTYR